MKLPYLKALEASTLYKAGVSYHAYGVIKQGKSAMFDYYKADSITEDQIATYCATVIYGTLRVRTMV